MKSLLALAGSLTTWSALAHPGHDHNSWTAPFLHALWIAPIVVAAVTVVLYLRKKANK